MVTNAVFNPHTKPVEELPVIYGFNNGGEGSNWYGQLIAEDGTPLGSHICSSESWMRNDLGVYEGCRPDRHETFQKHYPDGYRMEFVSHEKLMAAIKLANERPDDEMQPDTASVTFEYSNATKGT